MPLRALFDSYRITGTERQVAYAEVLMPLRALFDSYPLTPLPQIFPVTGEERDFHPHRYSTPSLEFMQVHFNGFPFPQLTFLRTPPLIWVIFRQF